MRSQLKELIRPGLESKSVKFGLELVSFGVKDISFPKEIKDLFSQVVKARKEGLASLERARNEQAALRSLANAANMIKDNPELLHLRKIQAMENAKGFISEIK